MELAGNNYFQFNQAKIQGGAIFWDATAPTIATTSIFENNIADIYGSDIGSYAMKLVVITKE